MIEFEIDMAYCLDAGDLDGVILTDENGELPEMVFVPSKQERTCHDFGGEEGTNGEGYEFACSSCGFCCDLPEPNYCPSCGSRVVM